MKVLILNGSPKENGNTAIALNEMIRIFTESLLLYDDSDQLRGIFTPSDKEGWVNMSIRCGIWRRSPGAVLLLQSFVRCLCRRYLRDAFFQCDQSVLYPVIMDNRG